MSLVIDASVALAWCFEDEASPATDRIAARVIADGGLVPALWHLEVANALLHAERRRRVAAADVAAMLRRLTDLPIEVDAETAGRAGRDTLALARAEKLTIYDGAYLELALRRGVALATRDEALAAAAGRRGVPVLP